MKNKILLLILAVSSLHLVSGQSKEKVKGTGPTIIRTVDLASFDQIESNIAADVEITQGATQKVVMEGQENILNLIQTEIKDKKWRIKMPKNIWADYDDVKIKITMPSLISIGLAGSGSIITTNTFKTDDFQVGLSGSGSMKLMVEADNIDCGLSGSGTINLKGKTKELSIGTSGSGDVKALDCLAETVKVGISGSGNCEVSAGQMLDAGIAGSGNVKYRGRPKVKTGISGSGSIQSID
ncbi:MAG: head GIN domain-containing protein [Saprospiraceae bacterium]|nr:head GIN domain-containing protein [Saprospiraceae bacterium]